MRLDTTAFPIVWMFEGTPHRDWESQLDALLARGERFVLITRQDDGDHDNHAEGQDEGHDAEDKKRRALWLKRNRALLKRWCAGGVFVVSGATKARMLGSLLQPLTKAFGFPLRIAEQADAESTARRLFDAGREH